MWDSVEGLDGKTKKKQFRRAMQFESQVTALKVPGEYLAQGDTQHGES